MVERAMGVAAERCPNHHRHRPVPVASITKLRDLVRDLVEGHMREVRELHLGDRTLAGEREPETDARDRRLGQRRVDDPFLTEALAQAVGDQEDSALLADILAEHHHAFIALHLFGEARAQRRDHVHLLGLDAGGWFDRGWHVRPVHVGERVLRRSVRRLHALPRRLGDLFLDLLLEGLDFFGAEDAVVEQPLLEALEAVVLGELVDLFLGSIAPLVVLRRVGAEAVDEAFDERRSVARAGARDGLFGHEVAGHRVAAVDGHARESVPRRALGDVLHRVLLVERRGDREAVVLADEDLRQLVDGGEVERLVRVAFGTGAFAVVGHDDLVGAVHLQRVSDAGAVHHLRRDRRAARDDVESRVREMAWRLLAARSRIGRLGEHRKHEVQRGRAHAHAEHDVAVVGRHPVVLRLQRPAHADLRGLVAGDRDDERRAALPVEDLEAVVDLPPEQDEVEPLLQSLLVEVGVAPRDWILEPPLGRELGLVLLCSLLARFGCSHQMWMAFPSTAIAASMTASLSVGCGWMLRPSSQASPWKSCVSAGSAISSVASGPTMWAPSSWPVFASATIFAKPPVSPWMIARPSAVKGNLPVFTSRAWSRACFSVNPTDAIWGCEYVQRVTSSCSNGATLWPAISSAAVVPSWEAACASR